ncbi:hypothetical protein EV183_001858 [Coemansia sp. RSA 2336]|nr:hypothetical protein EV183_001858 [Coemansia sp. RSA 2336]
MTCLHRAGRLVARRHAAFTTAPVTKDPRPVDTAKAVYVNCSVNTANHADAPLIKESIRLTEAYAEIATQRDADMAAAEAATDRELAARLDRLIKPIAAAGPGDTSSTPRMERQKPLALHMQLGGPGSAGRTNELAYINGKLQDQQQVLRLESQKTLALWAQLDELQASSKTAAANVRAIHDDTRILQEDCEMASRKLQKKSQDLYTALGACDIVFAERHRLSEERNRLKNN